MARKYYVIHSEQIPPASDNDVSTNLVEIMMKDTCAASDLPTNVAPSSIATAIVDGALVVYVYSADGAWEEVTI